MSLNKSSIQNITQQLQEAYNAKVDLPENYVPSVIDSNNYSNKIILTQYYRDLLTAIKSREINYNIDEFEPNNNWSFLNLNKFKLKWPEFPAQIKNGDQIYSLFTKNFIIRETEEGERLIVFKLDDSSIVFCVFQGSKELTINQIKSLFTRSNSKIVSAERVFLSHFKTDILHECKFPYAVSIAEKEMNLVYGLDFYRLFINRHGVYINHLNRNKLIINDELTINEDDITVNLAESFFWLEDINDHSTLFEITK